MKKLIIWAIVMGAGNYMTAKWYLHYSVSSDLDDAIIMMSPYADVRYEGVSSTMTGELSIDGITARFGEFRDEIYIDKMSIKTPSFLHLIDLGDIGYDVGTGDLNFPDSLGFSMSGIRAPVNADFVRYAYNEGLRETAPGPDADQPGPICTGKYGFSPVELERLGYQFVDVSMSMQYQQEDVNFVVDLAVEIADMGTVEFTVTLAGQMAEQAIGAAYRPKLVEGEVQFTDNSINERIRTNCSRAGLEDEEIMAAQLDAFSYDAEAVGIVYDEYVLDPYREFLSGKSVFVMTAKPNEPIALSQIDLYKPSDVPALLNLSASTH
jgi:hypothetical protein